ncbi:orotidine-5'-phosphate decarboxylase [Hydromonas duriensis]|uniref:Orotidine 5'-phosphate decarboxylase n=1 Tax=Hydromonas duriensis TaxID=1527608 RepID=A0A4R6Y8S6_9BURK|nr:orotidine-5'-phosphate decarboxylase [Hydromonas duriensis]TDR31839.1 orotidine-5'-phosphate decarboxylase [Hydromonas duriensis]
MNTTRPNFIDQLHNAWHTQNSLLCVGIDPDITKMPAPLRDMPAERAFFEFGQAIIDATAPYACSFKPQIAYFSAHHAEDALQELIAYSHKHHPHIPVILDAKRGDIGSTAAQYAIEAFERFKADAVTVNPYMGFDSVEPYLAYSDKGVIVLCRTSNPGGSDLQFLNVDINGQSKPLYQHVAHLVANQWNATGQCALVVGATFPNEIKQVRDIVGDMPLLIPGIGAQGGDLAATLAAGLNARGTGVMINSSRAIIYASNDEHFAQAAAQAAQETTIEINRLK